MTAPESKSSIIPSTWSLPEPGALRLSPTSYGKQRAIFEAGHLLLVLHEPPKASDATRKGLLAWRSPSGDWQFSRGKPGRDTLRQHVAKYAELEAQLTTRYEESSTTLELFEILESLTPLARSARNLHATLQAARDLVKTESFLIEMRDRAYELERNFDLLVEDVRNALQYRTAKEAEEQAALGREALRASHRLNVVAALFLPLTAISSLFGMSLPHGLGDRVHLFWFVTLGSLALGFAMRSWVLRGTPNGRNR